jgi:hypothetical protein
VRAADDLLFDQETVIQAHRLGLRVVEVILPARYFVRASPVGPLDSVRYGLATIGLLARDVIDRTRVGRWQLLERAWHAEVIYRARDERHRLGQATTPASPIRVPGPAGVPPAEPHRAWPMS